MARIPTGLRKSGAVPTIKPNSYDLPAISIASPGRRHRTLLERKHPRESLPEAFTLHSNVGSVSAVPMRKSFKSVNSSVTSAFISELENTSG